MNVVPGSCCQRLLSAEITSPRHARESGHQETQPTETQRARSEEGEFCRLVILGDRRVPAGHAPGRPGSAGASIVQMEPRVARMKRIKRGLTKNNGPPSATH